MINLLPDTEKEFIRKEYRLRVIAVILTFILVTILIGGILLIPSYVLTVYKAKVAENSSRAAAGKTEVSSTEKLQIAQKAVTILKPEEVLFQPSTIIALLFKTKNSGISIISISYSKKGKDPLKVNVIGVATTRQALVDFMTAVKAEQGIVSADIPVATFAKDTNIPFTMTITTK